MVYFYRNLIELFTRIKNMPKGRESKASNKKKSASEPTKGVKEEKKRFTRSQLPVSDDSDMDDDDKKDGVEIIPCKIECPCFRAKTSNQLVCLRCGTDGAVGTGFKCDAKIGAWFCGECRETYRSPLDCQLYFRKDVKSCRSTDKRSALCGGWACCCHDMGVISSKRRDDYVWADCKTCKCSVHLCTCLES
jgi:hypothetical protein